MHKNRKIFLILMLLAVIQMPLAAGAGWQPVQMLPSGKTPEIIAANRGESSLIFAASGSNLYARSTARNGAWKRLLRPAGNNTHISDIKVFQNEPHVWYVLTSNGLFRSPDYGRRWEKIFDGIGENNRRITAISQNPFRPKTLYLGTAGGILVSQDGGKQWDHTFAEVSKKNISDIAADRLNREIYFAADTSLYRYHLIQKRFDRVFTISFFALESNLENPADESNDEKNADPRFIRKILISASPDFPLAVGTAKGVFGSNDEGETWRRLPTAGLRSLDVQEIVYSKQAGTFFIATAKGIYKYIPGQASWREIYEGLPDTRAFDLALQGGQNEQLYAATEKGIFYYQIAPSFPSPEFQLPIQNPRLVSKQLTALLRMEPGIRDIQKEAIRYANVGNWKIKRWQTGSRIRNLIPDLSFSKSLDTSNNVELDRGSTSKPDFFIGGPEDRRRSTDMRLSWNLGDFIWSSSQTSIDSREKLMVELRDEILSEVTRLYFERRRLQLEFVLKPPMDPVERLQALLRIDEMTANIDALTNGYLSGRLNQLYAKYPHLAALWQTTTNRSIIISEIAQS